MAKWNALEADILSDIRGERVSKYIINYLHKTNVYEKVKFTGKVYYKWLLPVHLHTDLNCVTTCLNVGQVPRKILIRKINAILLKSIAKEFPGIQVTIVSRKKFFKIPVIVIHKI